MINLTQHSATPDQKDAGVIDLADTSKLKGLITFDEPPGIEELLRRAEAIAQIAVGVGAKEAMIGGAPYLMAPLETALGRKGIRAYYAFSRRESVEKIDPDGSVRKVSVFRHAGFVPSATQS